MFLTGLGRSIVVDHIRAKVSSDSAVGLSYVYFNYQTPEAHKPENVLCALLKQLCRHKDELPDELVELYRECKRQSQRPSLTSLETLLHLLIGSFQHPFLVIDAMDECVKEYRTYFLPYLLQHSKGSSSRLKIFVASRPEADIGSKFSKGVCETLQVEVGKVDKDIAEYVRDFIASRSDDENFCIIDPPLKKRIEETLVSQSNGM